MACSNAGYRLPVVLFPLSSLSFFPSFFSSSSSPPPSLLSFHFRPHGWSIARQFCISSGAGYYLSVDTEKLVFPDSQWWTIDQPPRIVDATNRETSFHKHSLFFSLFSLHTRRGQVSLFFFFFFRLIFFERRFFFFKLNLFDSSRFRQFVFFWNSRFRFIYIVEEISDNKFNDDYNIYICMYHSRGIGRNNR